MGGTTVKETIKQQGAVPVYVKFLLVKGHLIAKRLSVRAANILGGGFSRQRLPISS